MALVGGAIGGGVTTAVVWLVGTLALHNLPGGAAAPSLVALLLVAAVSGFLTGAAVARRAARNRQHLTLFSGVAGAVCGAIVGCAGALTLTGAYLASYASWPNDPVDQILVLLAYPAFAGVGLWLGGLAGLLSGWMTGLALGVIGSRPRARPV